MAIWFSGSEINDKMARMIFSTSVCYLVAIKGGKGKWECKGGGRREEGEGGGGEPFDPPLLDYRPLLIYHVVCSKCGCLLHADECLAIITGMLVMSLSFI